jgi:TonB family protein
VRRVMLATILAGLSAAGAMAQTPADVVEAPSWRSKPSGEDVNRYYPAGSLDRSLSGKVVLRCKVGLDGRARDCAVASEGPWGLGFGEAGKRLIEAKSVFHPGKVNGKPVDGAEMTIPLVFNSASPGARYVIYQPVWARAPDFAAMTAAWPAGKDGTEGHAVLRCSLQPDGSLDGCNVAGQSDGAFGRAAKGLVDRFQVRLTAEESARYDNSDVMVAFRFFNPASIEARTIAVKEPTWITTVKPEAVLAVYPAQAAEAGVKSGRGVADCLVAPDGKLTDCKVAREKPENLGFGASAVAIAQLMQMNPWTDKGRPVAGARIKLPIDFNLADEAAK